MHVYAIDATTGALPAVAASSLAVAPQPFALAIDAAGKFAYVVQPVSGQATVFAVDAHSGALTQTWETAQAPGRFPRAIALTP